MFKDLSLLCMGAILSVPFLILLPSPSTAATMAAQGITYCEDATASNKRAKRWEKQWQTAPSSDKEYFRFINTSPWCSIITADNPTHKSIIQYGRKGRTTHEIQIHKVGEQRWINKNWRSLKRQCTVPKMKLGSAKYRTPRPKGHSQICAVFIKSNPTGALRIHQHGLGRLMESLQKSNKGRRR